jgi:hypothetical protein
VGDRLAASVGQASRRVSARLAASMRRRVAAMAGGIEEGVPGGLEDAAIAAAAGYMAGAASRNVAGSWPGWQGPGRVYVHDLVLSRVRAELAEPGEGRVG